MLSSAHLDMHHYVPIRRCCCCWCLAAIPQLAMCCGTTAWLIWLQLWIIRADPVFLCSIQCKYFRPFLGRQTSTAEPFPLDCMPLPSIFTRWSVAALLGPNVAGCTIPSPPGPSVMWTNCTEGQTAVDGQACGVACSTGYDRPDNLAPGSCSSGTWTDATGSCSE